MAYTFAGEYFDALEDATTGKPVPGVAVTVYATGTTTKATLYSDRTKGTATSNPTSTSVEGNLQFFTDPGRYDLLVNGRTLGPVTIYPDVADVEDVTTLLNQLAAKIDTAGSGLTKTGTTLAADFGTAAGKVTQGNDARLSDARTPVAHAHPESDVTNLGTDLGTKVDTAGTGLVKSGTTLRRASAGSTFANLAALPSAASNPGRLERTADAGVYESDGTTWVVLVPPTGTYAPSARPVATASLGDSITAGGEGGAVSDPTNNYRGDDYLNYASLLSGGLLNYTYNGGVSGETTAQILARVGNVIASGAKACVVLGGINDNLANLGISDPTQLAAITTANLKSIYTALTAAGIKPIACTLVPNNTSGNQKHINIVNRWIQRYAAQTGIPCVDFYGLLVNPANANMITGRNFDQTHPNKYGLRDMGQALADVCSRIFAPSSPWLVEDNLSNNNGLFGNGLFLTDTNADGVPDGWAVSGSTPAGGTVALISDTSFAALGNALQLVNTAAGTSTVHSTPTWAGNSVGDRLAISGVISLSGGDANGSFAELRSLFSSSTGAADLLRIRIGADVTRGVFYGEAVVPAGTTGLDVQIILNGTGIVKLGQVAVTNLTVEGVA